MDSQTALEFSFDFGRSKPVVVEPSAAQVSSDAGLLLFRQLDEQFGLTEQFAAALTDRRDVGRIVKGLRLPSHLKVETPMGKPWKTVGPKGHPVLGQTLQVPLVALVEIETMYHPV